MEKDGESGYLSFFNEGIFELTFNGIRRGVRGDLEESVLSRRDSKYYGFGIEMS